MAAEVFLALQFLDELGDKRETLSATLRNVGLLGAAPLAFVIAAWRGSSAHRTADASQASVLNERYQSAAEMVASELLVTRLGGIHALGDLAKNHPESYHVRCVSMLCAFLRSHPESGQESDQPDASEDLGFPLPPPEDIRRAAEYVSYRHTEGRLRRRGEVGFRRAQRMSKRINRIEEAAGFAPDLSGASLRRLKLWHAKLAGANFQDADLRETNFYGSDLSGSEFFLARMNGAFLIGANLVDAGFRAADMTQVAATSADLSYARLSNRLSGAKFDKADLCGAILGACNLTGASLRWANLSGANFAPDDPSMPSLPGEPDRARLTQRQLDEAVADPLRPPTIAEGIVDIDTGAPVEWKGGNELPEGLEIRNGRLVRNKRKRPIRRDRVRSTR